MELSAQAMSHFLCEPRALPLYAALLEALDARYPNITEKIGSSQISFCDPRPFCWVWLPLQKRIKGRSEWYLLVSFGRGERLEHPRILAAVEPYPGRFTHHTLIEKPEDVDDRLLSWLSESHDFRNPPGAQPPGSR